MKQTVLSPAVTATTIAGTSLAAIATAASGDVVLAVYFWGIAMMAFVLRNEPSRDAYNEGE